MSEVVDRAEAPEGWLQRARECFPALRGSSRRAGPLFFDNPAGTQVPSQCIEAARRYWEQDCANSHGAFPTSQRTDATIHEARRCMAELLGASGPEEIVWGPNMTSLTMKFSRLLAARMQPGDEVIISDVDHEANIGPWLRLGEQGIVVRRIPLSRQRQELDLAAYEQMLGPKTRLVAVGYASNVLGTLNDVARIARGARGVGAMLWVDAVHYAPHGPIDVGALGADFLVCSAYKFFGPHVGVLWGKQALLDEIEAEPLRPAPAVTPDKFENGTKNHEGLAALVGTMSYLEGLGAGATQGQRLRSAMRRIERYERSLAQALCERLEGLPGFALLGAPDAPRVPTFSLASELVPPRELCRRLAERGLYCWAGDHYATTLLERLGLAEHGVLRVGAVHYNTLGEVDRLVEELERASR